MMKMHAIGLILSLFLFPSLSSGAEQIHQCAYTPVKSPENPDPELTPFADCGEISAEGTLALTKEHSNNINFGHDGLACIYINRGRTFYVHKNGRSAEAQYFDNGCDYFVEGLARGRVDNKIVFLNKKLEVVIRTRFDSASPFANGYAAVCNGGQEEKIGEHVVMRGGKCGYINRQGELVVPLRYSRETLPPPPVIEK